MAFNNHKQAGTTKGLKNCKGCRSRLHMAMSIGLMPAALVRLAVPLGSCDQPTCDQPLPLSSRRRCSDPTDPADDGETWRHIASLDSELSSSSVRIHYPCMIQIDNSPRVLITYSRFYLGRSMGLTSLDQAFPRTLLTADHVQRSLFPVSSVDLWAYCAACAAVNDIRLALLQGIVAMRIGLKGVMENLTSIFAPPPPLTPPPLTPPFVLRSSHKHNKDAI